MTKSMRAGEDITEPTDSPTAPTAVSHAQEALHSPLPWFVGHRNGNDEGAACGIDCSGECHFTIADLWADAEPELDEATARANAAFIVRACNHHEALIAVLRLIAHESLSGAAYATDRIRGLANDAIAKAEGQ